MTGLWLRAASGAVLLAIVLSAIWLRGPLLLASIAAAGALAGHEFYTIARRAGYAPWYPVGMALTLMLALRGYLGGDLFSGQAYAVPSLGIEVMVLALALLLALARQGFAWLRVPAVPASRGVVVSPLQASHAWAGLGLTLGGALYVGGLLGYAPLLAAIEGRRTGADGTLWLLLVVLGTAACDTGAYLVGSAIGKHKMIPHISPGKTWEGLGGGALGAVVATLALSGLLNLSLPQAVLLGLFICAAAVAGDLCESLLKRAARVKDSGHLIPGHGGVLDRIDSILFVLPAVYWFTQVAL